ncbi:unnamed protein product (macronuclear) [Paramecium tetraurelia]|uniref:Uncharacterized protein n=1 Tax=Paramecium tetraurelia TaxID=5888 RepID=A0CNG2_PARTE|nr:uncharacterized protein GSPATT00008771001 [Paramecium tetraurelia]CAK72329.1 unnamed protein product [Paramecium tetraurelia]|eukprot:XP_001439726.1 hypothetical protein (macronuclear) [Paramecium tetraurelia strain d4-2]
MKNKRQAQHISDESGLTYFEVFQKAISKFEVDNQKQNHKQDSDRITIYEDLKLILELSKISQIEPQHFEKISVLLKRSKTVLMKRYREYLKNINQDDLQTIFSFLQQNGAYGYLIFNLENGSYRLQDIEPIKQQDSPNKTPIQTPIKKIYQQTAQASAIDHAQQQQKIEPESLKKIKPNNFFQLSANSKYDVSHKKTNPFKQEQVVLDAEQKHEQEELKFTLKILSESLKISYQELCQRMYQCSGDLNTLLDVYLNRQENLLWTKEADEALNAYFIEENQFEKQKLRAILHGEEQIQKRKEWLYGK